MSEVKRYWVPHNTLADQSGWHQDDNEVMLAGEHDIQVAALREELGEAKGEYDRSANKVAVLQDELANAKAWVKQHQKDRDTAQQRLAAAEQRNAELEKAIKPFMGYAENAGIHSELGVLCSKGRFEITREDWRMVAALKPTESGASETKCCDRFPKCVCHEGADGL